MIKHVGRLAEAARRRVVCSAPARRLWCSPDLSDGHSDGLRIRLTSEFRDHSLVVDTHITAGPDAQAHAHPEPERVGGVALADAVDAGLAAGVVIGVADIHRPGVRLRLACPSTRNNGFWVRLEAPPTR